MVEIFVEDNSILRQSEVEMKGFRLDVYIKKWDNYYKLSIFTLSRLIQEVQDCFDREEIYDIEVNLLIVENMKNDTIVKTILRHDECGFFEELRPCEIEQGEIVYNLTDVMKEVYKEAQWSTTMPIKKLIKIF